MKKDIKTVGIIGYGDFGKFIETLTKKYFPEIKIKISSRSNKIDNKKFFDIENVVQSDLIFLTVPIRHIADALKNISTKIKAKNILVDVATVKEFPLKEIQKYPDLKYISSHPMFGPYSYKKIGEKLDGLRIVLTSHNLENEEYKILKKVLVNNLKLNLVEMSAEEHDKKLSETLFLTHLISQTIHQAGYERTDIDTVSFGFLMSAVESVKNDTELFKDVYKYNRFARNVVKKLEKTFHKIKDNFN